MGIAITLISMIIAAVAILDARQVRLLNAAHRQAILQLNHELTAAERRAAEGDKATDERNIAQELWHNFREAATSLQERGHTPERVESLHTSRAHLDQLFGWGPVSHVRSRSVRREAVNG